MISVRRSKIYFFKVMQFQIERQKIEDRDKEIILQLIECVVIG